VHPTEYGNRVQETFEKACHVQIRAEVWAIDSGSATLDRRFFSIVLTFGAVASQGCAFRLAARNAKRPENPAAACV